MKGSEKSVAPFNPPKSSSRSKRTSTGENNENHLSHDQMGPNLQNHGRVVEKHFMSPTISASSKAVPPRNRILVERNENSSCSKSQIHIYPESLSDRASSHVCFSYNHASESEYDGDANSCLKPYDPLTNYLSPRPKYMRFNPNRRSELFSRLERENYEELNGEEASSDGDVKDSSFTPIKETILNLENSSGQEDVKTNDDSEEKKGDTEKGDVMDMKDFSEEEEEEEEFEEGKGLCLRELLKFIIIFIACLFSTSYICSMNSSMPPQPAERVIWGLNDSYLMIQNYTPEVANEKIDGFLVMGKGNNYCKWDEEETDEIYNVEEHDEGHLEIVFENENHYVVDKIDEAGEIEQVGTDESELKADNSLQLICAKTVGTIDLASNGVKHEDGADKIETDENYNAENYEEMVEDNIVHEEGYVEKLLGNGSDYVVDKIDKVAESEQVGNDELELKADISSQQIVNAETNGSEDSGGYVLENDVEDFNQLEMQDHLKCVESQEESFEMSTDPVHEVDDEIGHDNEDTWKISAVTGVSIVSIISLASLVFSYHSKKVRNASAKQSEPAVKPSGVEEKKIEFSTRPSLLSPLMEGPRELSHNINAPSVELIGEIVVGEMSSRRSPGRKYESECNVVTILTKQAAALTSPPALDFSTTSDLDSDGNFSTARKKDLKKKGGKSGNAMLEVTTPVRRSSRLRNRATAAMSP